MNKENICPHCGKTRGHDYGLLLIRKNKVTRKIHCLKCGTKWKQVYDLTFSHFENISIKK